MPQPHLTAVRTIHSPAAPDEPDPRPPQVASGQRALDAFAYSSALAAAIAAAFVSLSSWILGSQSVLHWVLLASAGTFLVYNLDRLRDIDRDRQTSPLRTAFIERHRAALLTALAVCAIALIGLLWRSPPSGVALCVATGGLGLLHRRLKRFSVLKTLYVSTAWASACVGLPWLTGTTATGNTDAAWIAAILLAALTANLIASNLRDGEVQILRQRPNRVLWIARSATLMAMALCVLAPASILPLVWIPLAECFALGNDRPSERYGHVAVDGALLVGAGVSALHLALA